MGGDAPLSGQFDNEALPFELGQDIAHHVARNAQRSGQRLLKEDGTAVT